MDDKEICNDRFSTKNGKVFKGELRIKTDNSYFLRLWMSVERVGRSAMRVLLPILFDLRERESA